MPTGIIARLGKAARSRRATRADQPALQRADSGKQKIEDERNDPRQQRPAEQDNPLPLPHIEVVVLPQDFRPKDISAQQLNAMINDVIATHDDDGGETCARPERRCAQRRCIDQEAETRARRQVE